MHEALADTTPSRRRYGESLGAIKACLYHEAVAALECELDEAVVNPTFIGMGFGAMDPNVDRPAAAAAPAGEPTPEVRAHQRQTLIETRRRSTLVDTQITSNSSILQLAQRLAVTEE
ncbi:hypothetical protein TeGR_g12603 [Tetraparma gracilis]|uniref:Uncharacterized protein n=1 Tax=Tetraparma gracilis TaxID=2962635 RepID=A0ABQ6MUC0_9STRA|nr:hypothetical protein TeGR_g12603 [Tetraparma gracilis]